MTGYGKFEQSNADWAHVWEIKSVNGKFLDVKWRVPFYLRSLESEWEKEVRVIAKRGRVEINLHVELLSAELQSISFNEIQADILVEEMEKFAQKRGHTFVPDYNRFLGMSFLWKDKESASSQELQKNLTDGLVQALKNWEESTRIEGANIEKDLTQRVHTLIAYRNAIGERLPQILATKKENLEERIKDLIGQIDLSPERILQEVAILTDRLDVSEELTRLDSHLARLLDILQSEGNNGKRLDFLVQEVYREINTCNNKSQDIEISRLAVDFKAELERFREQIQNIA